MKLQLQLPEGSPIFFGQSSCFLDSGATNHLTADLNNLSMHSIYTGNDQVKVGDGTGLSIHHLGNAIIPSVSRPLQLNNVLHVPQLKKKELK